MKNIRSITCAVVIGLTLIAQMMSPVLAYADGEATPEPTATPEATSMPVPTETTPTEVIPSETPTSDPSLTTDTASPSATDVPVETSTPLPSTDIPEATATPEPAEATVVPIDTSSPVPEQPTETIDATVSTPEPVETTVPADASVVEEPTLLEVVQEVPSDTSIVVLDENGQPLSLASQDAAAIIENGDPMWCPIGITPGGIGCTASYATVTDLINFGAMSGSGTIYFTPFYFTNDATFDHNNPSLFDLTDLTIQGGWNGLTGINYSLSGNTTFSVPVQVLNWNNNVTIQNVSAAAVAVTGTGVTNVNINNVNTKSLSVWSNTSGNTINISNSSISNGSGAYIDGWLNTLIINNSHFDNNTGNGLLEYNGWGGITITGSTFNGNGGAGANINPFGGTNVGINNSSFNGNTDNGATISVTNQLTIDGNSTFNNNGNSGLYADVNTATINNSLFSGNSWYGAYISSTGNVTIGDSIFDNNSGDGTNINTNGNLNITNSMFTRNSYTGASISSNAADITNSVFSQNYIGAAIFSNGDANISQSNFDFNEYDGLRVFTNGGVIDIQDSTFNNNNQICADGYGAWLLGAGNIAVNNSAFNQNFAGLVYSPSNDINVNNSEFLSNYIGIGYNSFNSLNLQGVSFLGNLYDTNDMYTFPYSQDCYTPLPLVAPPQLSVSVQNQGTFLLDCSGDQTDGYSRSLPNGDLVEIFCPVSGEASIERFDSTTLPGDLPDGYTYASGFEVQIKQSDKPITVIEEGGYIRASFLASYLQPGNSYDILYWDAWEIKDGKWEPLETGKWVPLKDFMLARNAPRWFYLDPETENVVERKIISGVQLLSTLTDKRVDVLVNFPGIFVLAQH